jgi:hypothetical protein
MTTPAHRRTGTKRRYAALSPETVSEAEQLYKAGRSLVTIDHVRPWMREDTQRAIDGRVTGLPCDAEAFRGSCRTSRPPTREVWLRDHDLSRAHRQGDRRCTMPRERHEPKRQRSTGEDRRAPSCARRHHCVLGQTS